MIAPLASIDWRSATGAPASTLPKDERAAYFLALVWCFDHDAPKDVADAWFTIHFGHPPKRWWDKPQDSPAEVPLELAASMEACRRWLAS